MRTCIYKVLQLSFVRRVLLRLSRIPADSPARSLGSGRLGCLPFDPSARHRSVFHPFNHDQKERKSHTSQAAGCDGFLKQWSLRVSDEAARAAGWPADVPLPS